MMSEMESYDTSTLGKLKVDITATPVRKLWGGRRVRVDVKVTAPGLEGYKPVENSQELKIEKYELSRVEAEILEGAIGLLAVPASLEVSGCDTEGNRHSLYRLADETTTDACSELFRIMPEKKFDSPKQTYARNDAFYKKFGEMLSEKLVEKTGITPKAPPYKSSRMDN